MRVVENSYTIVCPPVREIIHPLNPVDYLPCGQAMHGTCITTNFAQFGGVTYAIQLHLDTYNLLLNTLTCIDSRPCFISHFCVG